MTADKLSFSPVPRWSEVRAKAMSGGTAFGLSRRGVGCALTALSPSGLALPTRSCPSESHVQRPEADGWSDHLR